MFELDVRRVDYERYSNRQLVAVPLVVLALALVVVGGWYMTTGAPANLGLEFTGGTELRVETTGSAATIEEAFDVEPSSIRSVAGGSATGETSTYVVTFQATDDATAGSLEDQAEEAGLSVLATQSTSPSFGAGTQQLALIGVAVAFLGMSLVVFLLFRTFVPSIAVVVSAFSDIVIPVAVMNLLGIQLNLGTVAALLMLIGYSVDSDILLNNHVLRRGGGFYESAYSAMRTGVTMTLTSLSAVIVMTVVATFFGVALLASIGTVLAIGLAADLMNTYLLNMSLLRYYRGVDV